MSDDIKTASAGSNRCSYRGCTGAHCWCGAALTAPREVFVGFGLAPYPLSGGVCRRDSWHRQDRPPVGFVAGRFDHASQGVPK